MTLREIYILLDGEVGYGLPAAPEAVKALDELEKRVEFLEKLIQDGLNLDDEFCLKFVWDGGSDAN